MDGFEVSLKKGLRSYSGDIVIYSGEGFFKEDSTLISDLSEIGVKEQTSFIQTEGFAIVNGLSKGVLVRGIRPESYEVVTRQKISLPERSVAIGSELAKTMNLSVGDGLSLVFASGRQAFGGLPAVSNFKISQIITHGIYQSDLRLVFVNLPDLQYQLDTENKVNMVSLNRPTNLNSKDDSLEIEDFQKQLRLYLGFGYSVRTYWSDYNYLINVVKTEKLWISLILQIIVVISIFNIIAFVLFVNERKRKEIFLFKALGMGQKTLSKIWYGFILGFWLVASLLSLLLFSIFNYLLSSLSAFQMPGDVYQLARLEMSLGLFDYVFVFTLSLIWLLLLAWFGLRKVMKQPILYGLRKEFS